MYEVSGVKKLNCSTVRSYLSDLKVLSIKSSVRRNYNSAVPLFCSFDLGLLYFP